MEELDLKALEKLAAPPEPPAKPSTITVLLLLAATAAVVSYLGAYALRDALARANLLHPAAGARDMRLFWAVVTFTAQMAAFLCVALVMRVLSWRQFRRIDQISDPDTKGEQPGDALLKLNLPSKS